MRGIDLRLARTVRRHPADVWAFIATDFFANHPKWDPAIVDMRQLTPGAVGAGTRGVEVRRFGGRQEAAFTVTEFAPCEHFVFVNTSGPFALERSYELLPQADGTEFVFRFAMKPRGLMRLLFPLFRATIERQVTANIDRLAGLLADPAPRQLHSAA